MTDILAKSPALGLVCSNCKKAMAVISCEDVETRNMIRDFLQRRRVLAFCTTCAVIERE